MDDWSILGISETRAENAATLVKQAYMKQLKRHNPEDDPEGFQRLRTAYENVIKMLAETPDDEAADDTPSGRLLSRVKRLYEDFNARIEPENWKVLLTDEAAVRLDLEEETETKLLRLLMEHYYLPAEIWHLLGRHFNWIERAEVLRKNFPGNFIDFVVRQAEPGGNSLFYRQFTYEGLEPPESAVYDRWLSLYLPLESSVIWQNSYGNDLQSFLSSTTETLVQLDELPLRHIHYDLLRTQIKLLEGNTDEPLTAAAALAAQWPDDFFARYTYGLALLAVKRYDESAMEFRAALAVNPDDFDTKRGLIDSLSAHETKEAYEEARELLLTLLDLYPFNAYALQKFRLITLQLTAIYEELHRNQPEDTDILLTLAKHYLNGFKYDECTAMLESFAFDGSDPRYYEYLADCRAHAGDYTRAIELYELNVAAVSKYHNYVKYVSTLLDAGQPEKALETALQALALNDDDTLSKAYLLDNKGMALFELTRFDEALDAYEDSLRVNGQTAHVYIHKAKACKKLGRLGEAIESCQYANNLYPFITEAYTLQMEIFYEADLYDRMIELAGIAEQYRYESPRVKYFKACALRMMNEPAQADAILDALLEDEDDEGYRDYFHAELAYIALARADYAAALRNMEEAIRLNGEPVSRHTFLANAHRLRGAYGEALAKYDELLRKWPDFIGALIGRGNTYFDMKEYGKALENFRAALAVNENNEQAFDRIIDTLLAENRYAEALPVAEREQTLFDNMENGLRLAWLYDKNNQPDAAKAAYEYAVEHYAEQDRPYTRYGYYCKNVLEQDEKAIEMFRQSLTLQPEQPLMYSEIAYCQNRLEQYEEALKTITEGISLFPNTGDLYIRRGLVLSNMFRNEEALRDLLKGVTFEKEIEPRWNMAFIYNKIGTRYELYFNDAENALKYYKLALERDTNYADAHKNIGDLYRYYYHKLPDAVLCYERKISLEPDEADGYLARAHAYQANFLLFRHRQARADFEKALAIYKKNLAENPDNFCLYTHMANCLAGLGQTDQAQKYYLIAIEKAPNSSRCAKKCCDEAYYGLSQLYFKQRQYDEALACIEKALGVLNCVEYNLLYTELQGKLRKRRRK